LPVIGFMGVGTDPWYAMQKGLADAGLVRDRDFTAEFSSDVAEIIRREPDVIITFLVSQALAAKAATTSISIIFQDPGDPVASGLVESWNRPAGNLTGVTNLNSDLIAKRLEVLLELVPSVSSIAFFGDATAPVALEANRTLLGALASKTGKRILFFDIAHSADIQGAFETLVREQAGGLILGGAPVFYVSSEYIASLAAFHKVPTIFAARQSAVVGGLASFGTRLEDGWYLMGSYAGRLVKGEKPANLPVQQITKTELVLNLKTAKALGVTVPLRLQARADEVIE
jgi:putative ABC transport system substrate-binding protein